MLAMALAHANRTYEDCPNCGYTPAEMLLERGVVHGQLLESPTVEFVSDEEGISYGLPGHYPYPRAFLRAVRNLGVWSLVDIVDGSYREWAATVEHGYMRGYATTSCGMWDETFYECQAGDEGAIPFTWVGFGGGTPLCG